MIDCRVSKSVVRSKNVSVLVVLVEYTGSAASIGFQGYPYIVYHHSNQYSAPFGVTQLTPWPSIQLNGSLEHCNLVTGPLQTARCSWPLVRSGGE